jgi:hypothetical protein
VISENNNNTAKEQHHTFIKHTNATTTTKVATLSKSIFLEMQIFKVVPEAMSFFLCQGQSSCVTGLFLLLHILFTRDRSKTSSLQAVPEAMSINFIAQCQFL